MSLERNFHKEVFETVTKLLVKAGIYMAPVPVKKIAENCGASVLAYNLGEEVSGVLVVEAGKGTIGYNSSNSKVRQRFTIAHELGHLLLHVNTNSKSEELFVDKDFIVKFRSEKQYSPKEARQEREANAFAAAILMPKEFILKEVRNQKYIGYNETTLIEELARLFEVSVPAMTYRFADLNIFAY